MYNDTVLTYNNAIQVLPAVVFAGMFGFSKRDSFEIEEAGEREAPSVSFASAPADAPSETPSS